MELTSKRTIKQLLSQHNLRPSKRLGQNFLISSWVVDKVIKEAGLKPADIVLEVGPGIGGLTIEAARRAKQVIAVEKDRKLASVLEQVLEREGVKNVEIINGDILKIQNSKVKGQNDNPKFKIFQYKKYKIIANLPYNIATAVIMKFLETKNPPQVMVVMLQKEVGQRICAKPPRMNKLAVFSQFYSMPEIIDYVSKRSFYPQPKVDSAILKIRPISPIGPIGPISRIVNAGFAHPRKQLVNNLSKALGMSRQQTEQWLSRNKVDPTQRAETLTINDWLNLTKAFRENFTST